MTTLTRTKIPVMKTLNEIRNTRIPKTKNGIHFADALESMAKRIIKTVDGSSSGYEEDDLATCKNIATQMLKILKDI